MKNFYLRGVATALFMLLSVGTTQAATITGQLFMTGQAVAIPGPTLGDAAGLSFTNGFIVTNASGDFSANGVSAGQSGTIQDFFFAGVPVSPFITVGSFSFVLESLVIVEQTTNFLDLLGTGTLSAAGFDDSVAEFSLSADGQGVYVFSATLIPNVVVPIPGALLLLASGLGVLGIRRRT